MLMSAYVGNWLDRHDRHFGAQAMLALNNLTVAISAALLAVCLSLNSTSGALYLICLCSSVLFFSVSNAGSLGEKIAFTKDWVVVLANRDKKAVLSTQNSILTMIDQLSAVLAPLIAGFILSYTSYRTGCIIFVGWNAFDWLLEAILLRSVYRAVPELATRIRTTNTTYETFVQPSTTPCQMIKVYLRQKVFPVAVAMALLYLTVLAFDGISVSYGKTEGLTESVL
uniref:Solute carrier family 40 member n=1 Tax=Acrobeloides nanus TaxID=290746 RepID=A0A914EBF6_9BILA